MSRRLLSALPWLFLLLITAVGMGLRLQHLDRFHVHPDSVYPFHDALRFWEGEYRPWAGRGSGFAYGGLQTLLFIPALPFARYLRDLMALDAVLHGLIVPLTALATMRLVGTRGALLAAVWMAGLPLLRTAPLVGAFTYLAPMWGAAATWAASSALTGSRWGAFALPLLLAAAILTHPYAVVLALGGAVLLPRLLHPPLRTPFLMGTLLGSIAMTPMILVNVALVQDGQSLLTAGMEMATPIEMTPVTGIAAFGLLLQETVGGQNPGSAVLLWIPVVGVLLGFLPLRTETRPGLSSDFPVQTGVSTTPPSAVPLLGLWFLASQGALLGVSVPLGYVTPTHEALLIPLLAVAACSGLVRCLGGLAFRTPPWAPNLTLFLACSGLALGMRAAWNFSLPRNLDSRWDLSQLAVIERVDAALTRDVGKNPRLLALVSESDISGPYRPRGAPMGTLMAFGLNARLSGLPASTFPKGPADNGSWAPAYVILEMSAATWSTWNDTANRARAAATVQNLDLSDPHRVPPREVYREEPEPGRELRVLAFTDLRGAAVWLRTGCALVQAGLPLWIDQYRHYYWRRDPTAWAGHVAFRDWAHLCPQPDEERWLRADPGPVALTGVSPFKPRPVGSPPLLSAPTTPQEVAPGVTLNLPAHWVSALSGNRTQPGRTVTIWGGASPDVTAPASAAVETWPMERPEDPWISIYATGLGDPRDYRRERFIPVSGGTCEVNKAATVCRITLYDPARSVAVIRTLIFRGRQVVQVDLRSEPGLGADTGQELQRLADTLVVKPIPSSK